jgi:hypothetical protein
MVLILQLGRLDLLELLRQSRHGDYDCEGRNSRIVACGEAVLAVMEKNPARKKRYGRFLAGLSISLHSPSS